MTTPLHPKPPFALYFCHHCGVFGLTPQAVWQKGCKHEDPTRYERTDPKLRAVA